MKIIIAIVASAISFSAYAAQPVDAPASTVVHYDDINLGTARGQALLDRRILTAAKSVCGATSGTVILSEAVESDRCVRTAISNAKTHLATARAPVFAAR